MEEGVTEKTTPTQKNALRCNARLVVWFPNVPIVSSTFVVGACKRDELAGQRPVQVTVFHLLVMFVFHNVKPLQVQPSVQQACVVCTRSHHPTMRRRRAHVSIRTQSAHRHACQTERLGTGTSRGGAWCYILLDPSWRGQDRDRARTRTSNPRHKCLWREHMHTGRRTAVHLHLGKGPWHSPRLSACTRTGCCTTHPGRQRAGARSPAAVRRLRRRSCPTSPPCTLATSLVWVLHASTIQRNVSKSRLPRMVGRLRRGGHSTVERVCAVHVDVRGNQVRSVGAEVRVASCPVANLLPLRRRRL